MVARRDPGAAQRGRSTAMIRQILVPLDGSKLAESILPSVEEFARLAGASVTLLQVIEPIESVVDLFGQEYPGVERDLQAADERVAHTYLTGVAQRLLRAGIVAHTRVVVGPVAETIIQLAHEFDLIAMATHGRSGIGRWVYGSVADKVLRGATVPVLLFRARESGPPASGHPRRILVPLDGSELAEHALPLAASIARLAGAEITLVRSISWATEFIGANAYLMSYSSADLIDLADQSARDYLREVAERLTAQGLTVHIDVRLDPAADGILLCAEQQHADLIVMSTHGRGGFGRWVYGSVADRVLRGASIPVLLVRANVPVAEEPVTASSAGASQ
jgi:nucleotide-binding universal stress UspA family protein